MSDPDKTSRIIHTHQKQRPDDMVTIFAGTCPQCGPDRPIRAYLEVRQCGHCGWIIKDPMGGKPND